MTLIIQWLTTFPFVFYLFVRVHMCISCHRACLEVKGQLAGSPRAWAQAVKLGGRFHQDPDLFCFSYPESSPVIVLSYFMNLILLKNVYCLSLFYVEFLNLDPTTLVNLSICRCGKHARGNKVLYVCDVRQEYIIAVLVFQESY